MLSKQALQKPIKIAISGKSGCGNSTTCRLLADKLNVAMINYTFRNLAVDLGKSFEAIRQEAEVNYDIDKMLDQRQIAMAHQHGSCVLGSRLAIWMLAEADLKVYLNVSIEERAERIMVREQGDYHRKLEETRERDELDHHRYKKIYNIDNDDFRLADLIVNTDKLSPEEVVDVIIAAIPRSYFAI